MEQVEFSFLHYYPHPSLLSLSYIPTEIQDHIYTCTLSSPVVRFHDHAHTQSSHGTHELLWTYMVSWLPDAFSRPQSYTIMSPVIHLWPHTSTHNLTIIHTHSGPHSHDHTLTHTHTHTLLFHDYTFTPQILMTMHLHTLLCEYTCLPPHSLCVITTYSPHTFVTTYTYTLFVVPTCLWVVLCTLDLSHPSTWQHSLLVFLITPEQFCFLLHDSSLIWWADLLTQKPLSSFLWTPEDPYLSHTDL